MTSKTAPYISCICALILLAGCGVDGEPEAPPPPPTTSTSVAVGVGSRGVSGGVATTITQGSTSFTLGIGNGLGCWGGFGRRCW